MCQRSGTKYLVALYSWKNIIWTFTLSESYEAVCRY